MQYDQAGKAKKTLVPAVLAREGKYVRGSHYMEFSLGFQTRPEPGVAGRAGRTRPDRQRPVVASYPRTIVKNLIVYLANLLLAKSKVQ